MLRKILGVVTALATGINPILGLGVGILASYAFDEIAALIRSAFEAHGGVAQEPSVVGQLIGLEGYATTISIWMNKVNSAILALKEGREVYSGMTDPGTKRDELEDLINAANGFRQEVTTQGRSADEVPIRKGLLVPMMVHATEMFAFWGEYLAYFDGAAREDQLVKLRVHVREYIEQLGQGYVEWYAWRRAQIQVTQYAMPFVLTNKDL